MVRRHSPRSLAGVRRRAPARRQRTKFDLSEIKLDAPAAAKIEPPPLRRPGTLPFVAMLVVILLLTFLAGVLTWLLHGLAPENPRRFLLLLQSFLP
jgi:hypothetical protein